MKVIRNEQQNIKWYYFTQNTLNRRKIDIQKKASNLLDICKIILSSFSSHQYLHETHIILHIVSGRDLLILSKLSLTNHCTVIIKKPQTCDTEAGLIKFYDGHSIKIWLAKR